MRTKSMPGTGGAAQAAQSRGSGGGAMVWSDGAKSFIAGAVAGTLSKTVTAPLARITILRQVSAADPSAHVASGMKEELSAIVRRGGMLQLFRGNMAAVCHRIPFSGMYHGTYNFLRKQRAKEEDFAAKLVNGSIAGATACTVAYPLDLARSLIASNRSSSASVAKTLLSEMQAGGLSSIYRGLRPTLLTVTPNLGVNYAVYDTVMTHFATNPSPHLHGPMPTLIAAACAGVSSSIVTHPLDLVRRVMQIDGAAGSASKFNGDWYNAFRTIGASSPKALWRGLIPEIVKVVPSVCLTFTTFEFMKTYVL